MKKYLILITLLVFAGLTINCGSPPIPQGAFRVRTKAKVHLFGIPLPFSVPNPGIAINLKLTATPPAGTYTGTVGEFNQGGGFVPTDGSGIFDANNAIIPAIWNGRIAPNQSRCSAPVSNPFSFAASNGSKHNMNCKWNVQISFLVQPNAVAVGLGDVPEGFVHASTTTPSNSLTGILNKEYGKRYSASDLKALYYRQVSGEDYILEGEKSVTSISADGTSFVVPVPNYHSNQGIHHYRILIKEHGTNEIYLGHGEMDVSYMVRRNCPGSGNTCQ